ncbi:hypothetical protein BASA81_011111 [Batrachochytrium salamandrivorans]|nr:hypothetical protein BASA81_011111 [Batrachochytrium salamandrivorans]
MEAVLASLLHRLEQPGPLVGFESDLVLLKRLSRHLHDESSQAKDRLVQVVKLQVEACQLALQSTECELEFYQKELPNCLSTPIFDKVEFAEGNKEDGEGMENKLKRIEQEIELRQSLTHEIHLLNQQVEVTNQQVIQLEGILTSVPPKVEELASHLDSLQRLLLLQPPSNDAVDSPAIKRVKQG